MTAFFTKLLALDLPFYEIHAPGYDPMKEIIDFWNLYDLESCRNFMMTISKTLNGSSETKEQHLEADQIEVFLVAMTRLIIAYYVTHDKGLDFGKLDLLSLQNYEANKRSLEVSKLIYKFFNRMATKPINKL